MRGVGCVVRAVWWSGTYGTGREWYDRKFTMGFSYRLVLCGICYGMGSVGSVVRMYRVGVGYRMYGCGVVHGVWYRCVECGVDCSVWGVM